MKLIALLCVVLLISLGSASAQDVTGFKAPNQPGVSPESSKRFPNPNVVLKPQLGGIFVDGAKYGTVMISPGAPASYGMGEKYLAAPRQYGPDLERESAYAAHRDTGGLKLFSLEF